MNGVATTAGSPNLREEPRYPTGRLVAWLAIVLSVSALNYAGNYLVSKKNLDTEDALYHFSTAVQAVFIYGVMLLLVCWIAGWHRRPLAWRQPRNWAKAIGIALALLVGVFIVNLAIDPFLHAGREQGAIPKDWKPAHAAAYAVNWVVVAGVAPFVEETTYRGLGFTLLYERWGKWFSVVAVGILFAVSHGLVQALPELALFGGALAWLRWKVDSTYPGMIVHSAFNSIALASVFGH